MCGLAGDAATDATVSTGDGFDAPPADAIADANIDVVGDLVTDAASDVSRTDVGCTPHAISCASAPCGLLDDGCGGFLACVCAVPNIAAGRLAWDAAHGLAYATVRASSLTHPNEVIALDPSSMAIPWSVVVGSDPLPITVADDGNTAWVGLRDTYTIRRFDVRTRALQPERMLPRGVYAYPSFPTELVPIAGSPGSVIVSMRADGLRMGSSADYPMQLVMDDGTPRLATVGAGSFRASSITGNPSGFVYGFNNFTTGFEFVVMTLDATGLHGEAFHSLLDGFGTTIRYAAGRVYASNGRVFDMSDPTLPNIAAMLPPGTVYADAATDVGYILNPYPCTLSRFRQSTLAVDRTVNCQGITEQTVADFYQVAPGRFIAVGIDYRAATSGTIYVIDSPF